MAAKKALKKVDDVLATANLDKDDLTTNKTKYTDLAVMVDDYDSAKAAIDALTATSLLGDAANAGWLISDTAMFVSVWNLRRRCIFTAF